MNSNGNLIEDIYKAFDRIRFSECDGCSKCCYLPWLLREELDCRLFPLDIIEEDGKYYWCVFTICPKHEEIRKKLIPLIPLLEKLISREMFGQYKTQISITKEIYLPYKLRQYEKIRQFDIRNVS